MSNKVASLLKRVRSLRAAATKHQLEQQVEFVTYWGDEDIPDDGSPVFVTDWGGGALSEEDEDEAE
jgi:hypothetical protein